MTLDSIKPSAWKNGWGEANEHPDSYFRFPLYDEVAVRAYAAEQVAAEREACAMVCDLLLADPISSEWARATHDCAAAIRARAQGAVVAESAPVDLDRCPSCGGEADNGNDRLIPPNPYPCSKCDPR